MPASYIRGPEFESQLRPIPASCYCPILGSNRWQLKPMASYPPTCRFPHMKFLLLESAWPSPGSCCECFGMHTHVQTPTSHTCTHNAPDTQSRHGRVAMAGSTLTKNKQDIEEDLMDLVNCKPNFTVYEGVGRSLCISKSGSLTGVN